MLECSRTAGRHGGVLPDAIERQHLRAPTVAATLDPYGVSCARGTGGEHTHARMGDTDAGLIERTLLFDA